MVTTRDAAPDALRGFALWGIIVVNVAYFSSSVHLGLSAESLGSTGDTVAAFLVQALASGKFYLLFSFLFGYSARYLLAKEKVGRTRWVTRSFGLVALGVAHAALFFVGDILFLYGLLAFTVLAFYGRSRGVIIRWIAWLYGIFAALLISLVALTWVVERAGLAPPGAVPVPALDEIARQGSYLESIPARFELWSSLGVYVVLFQGVLTLVAFLVGILAARSHFLDVATMPRSTLQRLLGWGLGLGLPMQLLIAGVWVSNELSAERTETIFLATFFGSFLSAPLLSAGYLGLIAWLVRTKPQITTWLGRMGQISLTVYLSQSIALSLIFSAWGGGLYQGVPYWVAILIALGLALVLGLGASLWLTRFSHGPMERALTWFSLRFVTQER
jgi:uncharacterized protein